MFKYIRLYIILPLCFTNSLWAQVTSTLLRTDSAQYVLKISNFSKNQNDTLQKIFFYPVLKLRQADIDRNGTEDFILEVIKQTRFDSTFSKRINIWQIKNGAIVPLWLGSKMSHPLVDFEIFNKQENTTIITIEKENTDSYLVAEYYWHSFGLKFIRYLKRNINIVEAKNMLIKPY